MYTLARTSGSFSLCLRTRRPASDDLLMQGDPELRVESALVKVSLHLVDGRTEVGRVSVAREAASHHGRERVKDVLNQLPAMFPLAPLAEGARPALFNKQHVLYVSLFGPDFASDTDQQADLSHHRLVHVRLSGGLSMRGELFITTPPGRERTLDFLNRGDAFFYLRAEDGLKLIHLVHVVSVEDEDVADT